MQRRDFLCAAALVPPAVLTGANAATAVTDAGSGALGLVGLSRPPTRTLRVIGRGAWGGVPRRDGMKRHVPRRLTLHHMDVRVTGRSQGPATARHIQQFHMRHLGHADIDYHFLVDRAGFVYQGRSPKYVGDTQTEYDPTGHFLVCCLGDYEGGPGPAQRPTTAMVRSLTLLLAWASQRWDIRPGTIAGHRDYASTSCPGRELDALIRDGTLRSKVSRASRFGTVRIELLRGREGRRLVRRIEAEAV